MKLMRVGIDLAKSVCQVQLHTIAARLQQAPPVMRTTARLHANFTTRLNRLDEDSEPICSRQFPPPYHALVAINPMPRCTIGVEDGPE